MAKKIRYIEFCSTDGCKTKRPTFEKSKSGFTCYRCNRKDSRKNLTKKV